MGKMGGSPLAGLAALGLGGIGGGPNTGPVNPAGINCKYIYSLLTED